MKTKQSQASQGGGDPTEGYRRSLERRRNKGARALSRLEAAEEICRPSHPSKAISRPGGTRLAHQVLLLSILPQSTLTSHKRIVWRNSDSPRCVDARPLSPRGLQKHMIKTGVDMFQLLVHMLGAGPFLCTRVSLAVTAS